MSTTGIRGCTANLFGGLLLATTADQGHGQGGIIYHYPSDVLLISSGGSRFSHPMDLNADGAADFVFEAYTSFQIYSTTGKRSVGIPAIFGHHERPTVAQG